MAQLFRAWGQPMVKKLIWLPLRLNATNLSPLKHYCLIFISQSTFTIPVFSLYQPCLHFCLAKKKGSEKVSVVWIFWWRSWVFCFNCDVLVTWFTGKICKPCLHWWEALPLCPPSFSCHVNHSLDTRDLSSVQIFETVASWISPFTTFSPGSVINANGPGHLPRAMKRHAKRPEWPQEPFTYSGGG